MEVKRTLSTVLIKVGEKAAVTLKIHENEKKTSREVDIITFCLAIYAI